VGVWRFSVEPGEIGLASNPLLTLFFAPILFTLLEVLRPVSA
jgi:hypothetical protein